MTSRVRGGRAGHQRLILKDDEEEVNELVPQIGPTACSLEFMKDANLDSSSGNDDSLIEDDPPFYERF